MNKTSVGENPNSNCIVIATFADLCLEWGYPLDVFQHVVVGSKDLDLVQLLSENKIVIEEYNKEYRFVCRKRNTAGGFEQKCKKKIIHEAVSGIFTSIHEVRLNYDEWNRAEVKDYIQDNASLDILCTKDDIRVIMGENSMIQKLKLIVENWSTKFEAGVDGEMQCEVTDTRTEQPGTQSLKNHYSNRKIRNLKIPSTMQVKNSKKPLQSVEAQSGPDHSTLGFSNQLQGYKHMEGSSQTGTYGSKQRSSDEFLERKYTERDASKQRSSDQFQKQQHTEGSSQTGTYSSKQRSSDQFQEQQHMEGSSQTGTDASKQRSSDQFLERKYTEGDASKQRSSDQFQEQQHTEGSSDQFQEQQHTEGSSQTGTDASKQRSSDQFLERKYTEGDASKQRSSDQFQEQQHMEGSSQSGTYGSKQRSSDQFLERKYTEGDTSKQNSSDQFQEQQHMEGSSQSGTYGSKQRSSDQFLERKYTEGDASKQRSSDQFQEQQHTEGSSQTGTYGCKQRSSDQFLERKYTEGVASKQRSSDQFLERKYTEGDTSKQNSSDQFQEQQHTEGSSQTGTDASKQRSSDQFLERKYTEGDASKQRSSDQFQEQQRMEGSSQTGTYGSKQRSSDQFLERKYTEGVASKQRSSDQFLERKYTEGDTSKQNSSDQFQEQQHMEGSSQSGTYGSKQRSSDQFLERKYTEGVASKQRSSDQFLERKYTEGDTSKQNSSDQFQEQQHTEGSSQTGTDASKQRSSDQFLERKYTEGDASKQRSSDQFQEQQHMEGSSQTGTDASKQRSSDQFQEQQCTEGSSQTGTDASKQRSSDQFLERKYTEGDTSKQNSSDQFQEQQHMEGSSQSGTYGSKQRSSDQFLERKYTEGDASKQRSSDQFQEQQHTEGSSQTGIYGSKQRSSDQFLERKYTEGVASKQRSSDQFLERKYTEGDTSKQNSSDQFQEQQHTEGSSQTGTDASKQRSSDQFLERKYTEGDASKQRSSDQFQEQQHMEGSSQTGTDASKQRSSDQFLERKYMEGDASKQRSSDQFQEQQCTEGSSQTGTDASKQRSSDQFLERKYTEGVASKQRSSDQFLERKYTEGVASKQRSSDQFQEQQHTEGSSQTGTYGSKQRSSDQFQERKRVVRTSQSAVLSRYENVGEDQKYGLDHADLLIVDENEQVSSYPLSDGKGLLQYCSSKDEFESENLGHLQVNGESQVFKNISEEMAADSSEATYSSGGLLSVTDKFGVSVTDPVNLIGFKISLTGCMKRFLNSLVDPGAVVSKKLHSDIRITMCDNSVDAIVLPDMKDKLLNLIVGITEKRFSLLEEHRICLKNGIGKWQELTGILNENCSVERVTSSKEEFVSVIGFVDDVKKTYEEIVQFFKRKTSRELEIKTTKSIAEFVMKQHKHFLSTIEEKLFLDGLKICLHVTTDDTGLCYIRGTKGGIDTAVRELQSEIKPMFARSVPMSQQWFSLSRKETSLVLCDDERIVNSMCSFRSSGVLPVLHLTKNLIIPWKGTIFRCPVDAFIDFLAEGSNLRTNAGKDIIFVGDSDFDGWMKGSVQGEILLTNKWYHPGNFMIHLHLPNLDVGSQQRMKALEFCISNALRRLLNQDPHCGTIGVGIPCEKMCPAKEFCLALVSAIEGIDELSEKKIILIDDDQQLVASVLDVLGECFPSHSQMIHHSNMVTAESAGNTQSDRARIDIVDGELSEQEVDAIVNSTNKNLELNEGAISKSLLAKGGPELQKECKRKYPNGIKFSQVAITMGHQLKCRNVFHIALSPYRSDNEKIIEKNLRELLVECLKEANRLQLKSIAFPLLGFGQLKYPLELVLYCMKYTFTRLPRTSSVPLIRIVLYKPTEYLAMVFREVFAYTQDETPAVTDAIADKNQSRTCYLSTMRDGGWIQLMSDDQNIVDKTIKKLLHYENENVAIKGGLGHSQYKSEEPNEDAFTRTLKGFEVEQLFFYFGDEFQSLIDRHSLQLEETENETVMINIPKDQSEEVKYRLKNLMLKLNSANIISEQFELKTAQERSLVKQKIVLQVQTAYPSVICYLPSIVGSPLQLSSRSWKDIKSALEFLQVALKRKKPSNRRANRFSNMRPESDPASNSPAEDHKSSNRTDRFPNMQPESDPASSPSTISFSLPIYKNQNKLIVKVYVSDILCLKVDGIVNAANSQLLHGGGVARAISEAAGPNLNRECRDYIKWFGKLADGAVFTSTAGNLPYKCVIHAVGPVWQSNPDYCYRKIKDAVYNSLMEANKKGLQSVALPSISLGIFAVPEDICVKAYLDGLVKFSYEFKDHDSTLQEVHFVDQNEDICRTIHTHFSRNLSTVHNLDLSSSQTVERLNDEVKPLIHQADVLTLDVDVVIWPRSEEKMKEIQSQADKIFVKECKRLQKTENGAFHIKSSYLPCKWVVFIDCSAKSFQWQMKQALCHSNNLGAESVALSSDLISPDMFPLNEFLSLFENADYSSIKEVHLVNKEFNVIQVLLETFYQHGKVHRGKSGALNNGMNLKNDAVSQTIGKDDEECQICFSAPADKILHKCKHRVCSVCWEQCLKTKPVCPFCGILYGVLTGDQPSGKMSHIIGFQRLGGYENYKSIEIYYTIPAGSQASCHPNPGWLYPSANRTAYLPDSPEGRDVLKMLQLAFERGLIFTIGTSRTTGQCGITWNDIHHKTNRSGGPQQFGYPDDSYLARVTQELHVKGITKESIQGRKVKRVIDYKQHNTQL